MRRLLLVAALLSTLAPLPMASAEPDRAAAGRVQHLVVMTQDGHSFDSYLGTRAGVDGLPAGVCMPLRPGTARPCVAPFQLTGAHPGQRLDSSAAAQQRAVAGGRMDGFVQAQSERGSDGSLAMGHYGPQDVPALTELADRGVLFDRWFSSVPGGGIPNRLFALAAYAPPPDAAVPAAGWGDLPVIFDRLTAAGVSWRVYVENYEPRLTIQTASSKALLGGQIARVPLLAMHRYVSDPRLASHVVDLSRYYADADSGTLPAVSYVVSTASTEHPPGSPRRGQSLVRTVANSLFASPQWPSSAFVLSYDSPGGFYDHVLPPTVGRGRLGLRVPTVLVSPFVRPGLVDHHPYDAAAVLRFVEDNWHVAPLTARDRDVPTLMPVFAFDQAPRRPALLGTPAAGPRLRQPDSTTLYLGYASALALAAAVLWWAALGRSQDPRRGGPA